MKRIGLLVIDVQMGFKDASWGRRNVGEEFERRIADLLATWRLHHQPVFHVNHDSSSPEGRFRPGTPGNAPMPEARPLAGEPIFRKRVNSAFIGTGLEGTLRDQQIATVVVIGLTTSHCVSTTVRMSGNLGFDTYVVSDGTATFDRIGLDGGGRSRSRAE